MKKLMLAVVAASATIVVNGATVNWGSGVMQTPTSADNGALSGNRLTTASGYSVKMYVWEALAAADVSYSAGDLLKWYQNGASSTKDPFGGSVAAITVTPTVGASATSATARGSLVPSTEGDPVYGAILFVLEDASSGTAKWYMENSASVATAKSAKTQGNLSLTQGGVASGTAMAWTAVPEPTSGLLMLLGVAGLALKRKLA